MARHRKHDTCPHCKGKGILTETVTDTQQCVVCGGSGYIGARNGLAVEAMCYKCRGSGKRLVITTRRHLCPTCLGTGILPYVRQK